ncbi:MAG: PqiC family protein, partial [Silvanigrellaceae bacterium]|nr:PqiC family protein [Silvanigrellaceae bacterium]
PWDIIFKPTYHMQITISDFTIDLAGKSTLSADYVVYYKEEAIKKESRYYQLKLTNPNIKELVGSMNTNLNRLTQDMAATIRTLGTPSR